MSFFKISKCQYQKLFYSVYLSRFKNRIIIENKIFIRFEFLGVSIHETFHHIVILVATVSSVHKLVFTHPKCVHKQDLDNYYNTNEGFPSILAEASNSTPVDHFYVIPGTGVGKKFMKTKMTYNVFYTYEKLAKKCVNEVNDSTTFFQNNT